jgi:hypothetical protein
LPVSIPLQLIMQEPTKTWQDDEEEAIARSLESHAQEVRTRADERKREDAKQRDLAAEEWSRVERLATEESRVAHAEEDLREKRRMAGGEKAAQQNRQEWDAEAWILAASLAAYEEEQQKKEAERANPRPQNQQNGEANARPEGSQQHDSLYDQDDFEIQLQLALRASLALAESSESGPIPQDVRQEPRPAESSPANTTPDGIDGPSAGDGMSGGQEREALHILETAEEGSAEHLRGLAMLDGDRQPRDAADGLEEEDAPPPYEAVSDDRTIDHLKWTTDGSEGTPGTMQPLTRGQLKRNGPRAEGQS